MSIYPAMPAAQNQTLSAPENPLTPAPRPLLDAALYCVEKKGWFVFPLSNKSKIPDAQLAPNGYKSASNDPQQIREWWATSPHANIGVDLGRSNLTVLDFDNGTPPAELDLPETLWVKTSRGTHIYFSGISEQQKMYFNGTFLGDIKSRGGYVLAPFSIHPDGATYSVVQRTAIAPLPIGLIDRLRATERKQSPTLDGGKIPHGQHDNELTRIAGKLRSLGMEEDAIFAAIVEVCEKRCENYGEDYKQMCRTIAHSVCKYPSAKNKISGVSIANLQSTNQELEFHLPAVEKVSHRDYVIAPAMGEKDGWFPRGAVSLVAGPSGASKTTWMLQLLIAQGIKVSFYGHDTFGRTYLMLGADRGEDAHKRTMERMNLSHAAVPFKPLPLAWDIGAAQAIVDKIESTEPLPEIVFVEGVDMMVTEVNNIKTVARFVHHLDKIAHHYRVALIGSLGSPKVKEGHGYSATRDNLLGSGGWGRTVETVALLQFPKNDDTNGRRNLTVALRNAPAEKFSLKFADGLLEIDPASYEENDGAAQASQETDWYQEQARLAKVDLRKTWWTIRDMELALKLSHRTADRHVSNDYTKRIILRKPGAKNGRGSAAEYRWNESSKNPLWIPEQPQVDIPRQATF